MLSFYKTYKETNNIIITNTENILNKIFLRLDAFYTDLKIIYY